MLIFFFREGEEVCYTILFFFSQQKSMLLKVELAQGVPMTTRY